MSEGFIDRLFRVVFGFYPPCAHTEYDRDCGSCRQVVDRMFR